MKTRTAIGAIVGMAILACGHMGAQGRPTARRFTLGGTVVDEKGKPVSGAELSIDSNSLKEQADPAISDAQGRFAFAGLPPGEYMLTAKVAGFGTMPYGESNDHVPIRLGGERGDKAVVFRISPRGFVEGSIRDEFGDAMPSLSVSLQRPAWATDRLRMVRSNVRVTDDRGHYRFGNLAPGNYLICVSGSETPAPAAGPVDYNNLTNRYLAHTCSRTVQVAPGQHAQVDLTPTTTTAVTVRGHVSNLPPQTGFTAFMTAEDEGADENRSAFVDATQGTFTFRGVAPGRYLLNVRSNSQDPQKSAVAEMPLDVGSEIDGLEVQLGAEPTVDVSFHGVPKEEESEVSALLRAADRNGSFRGSITGQGGLRRPVPLAPGRYWVDVRTPRNSCVESVKLGDRELRGGTFEASAGANVHLDVTLTQTCGTVKVRSVRDGTAVPGAMIVMLPAGSLEDARGVKINLSDDEGAATFSGLPPGRYLLWSWATAGAGAMAGPSSLAAVQSQAATVEVTAGDPVSLDVPLLSNEGKLP